LTREFLRIPFVIVVQKGHEFATCIPNSGIPRRGTSLSTLMSDGPDSFVSEAIHNALDANIGSVVYHKKLEISERLAEHAANRSGQQAWPVTSRNDDANL
jgi:hypothetical protein